MELNPNLTWKLVEQRFEAETDPIRKRNLGLVLAHMRAEAQMDIEGVVATLSEKPRYRTYGTPEDDHLMNPTGSADAVRAFYEATIVKTGAHRLEFACDRVIADEMGVFTEGEMRIAYPGHTLLAMGIEVDDPDGYYVHVSRMGIVWPVEEGEGKLRGEEVYSVGNGFEGITNRKISLAEIRELEPAA